MQVSLRSLIAEYDDTIFITLLNSFQGKCQNAVDEAVNSGTSENIAKIALFLIELYLYNKRADDTRFERAADEFIEHADNTDVLELAESFFNRLKSIW